MVVTILLLVSLSFNILSTIQKHMILLNIFPPKTPILLNILPRCILLLYIPKDITTLCGRVYILYIKNFRKQACEAYREDLQNYWRNLSVAKNYNLHKI